jgi:hypothetical protein
MIRATIWTGASCRRCAEAVDVLRGALGQDAVETRDMEALQSADVPPEDRDLDAMAQLAAQCMALPVVLVDGVWVSGRADALIEALAGEAG